jgi:7-cyano-7-deazaguanine tRNA-ribosyltransferase
VPVSFEARSTEGLSRLGTLETPHGTVQTPAMMPVVNPNRILIEPQRMREVFGTQIVITNAYIIRKHGDLETQALDDGVHELIDWDGPLVTDSGTFQDYVYGDIDLDPQEIVAFQRDIGSDVGTILDVFSPPDTEREQARQDADDTLLRARDAIREAGDTTLNLPVQGATFPDLREQAARDVARLEPSGGAVHPIGGVVPLMEDQDYRTLVDAILGAQRGLHAGRPVHLFGAGHPHMLALAVYLGCDLFDSAAYAKFADDDRLVFPWGTLGLDEVTELACTCPVCRDHTADELRNLPDADRVQALGEHNLHVTHAEMRRIRQAQRTGRLLELVLERVSAHPALDACKDVLGDHVDQLEAREPTSHERAATLLDHGLAWHPQRHRARQRVERRIEPRGDVTLLEPTKRPFTAQARDRVRELRARGLHPFFPSRLGPVPYDLAEAYPFSQCREGPITAAIVDRCAQRLDELAEAWNVDRVDPQAAHKRPTGDEVDLTREQLAARASYQFGPRAGDRLLEGDLELETSPRSGRIKTVTVDGEHVLSRRPYDGLFTLKLAGARRIHDWLPRPFMRVQVDEDSAPFNAEGRSVFGKFVLGVQKGLRPGDECLVVDPDDELVACGRLRVSPAEMKDLASGPVVDVREGIERDAYEA